jgi:hypothetical protein
MLHMGTLKKKVDEAKKKAATIAAALAEKKAAAAAAAAIAKEVSGDVGKGKGDGDRIELLAAYLKVEAENQENPFVIVDYDLDDDDDDMVITSSTSDEKKSAGRKIKKKPASHRAKGSTRQYPRVA